tara:strand:- start:3521 stop:4726 length:1206 start_codon:yes stop_codon:yes gene_type:complete
MFNLSKYITNTLISFCLCIGIFYLSLNQELWFLIWGSLSIPPQIPFSDLKAHIHFFNCHEAGIDIFSKECPLIPYGGGAISTHPPIWLDLVSFFKLNKDIYFNAFILISYFIYFYLFFNLFKTFDSFHSKVFLLIFFFSTTNFILIERYSTDLLIFIFISLTIFFRSNIIKLLLIFIGTVLKFYPIFSLLIFVKNKKFFFFSALFFILFLCLFYLDQILSTSENLIEMALFTAYGSRTMFKAFYYLSENYGFFLNENNIEFFRDIAVSLVLIYSIILTLLSYFYFKIKSSTKFSLSEEYFLIGSTIYIGTFIFAANADYRLIFLIFTIPHILQINSGLIKYILILCIIVSINSFLFQFGDPLSISFFIRAFFIFGCKFVIFSLFLVLIGNILKKINFLKFN